MERDVPRSRRADVVHSRVVAVCAIHCQPTRAMGSGTQRCGCGDHGPPGDCLLDVRAGDDLTDEDAFDAIRFGGVGIVVRHGEDGDRKSAARFTLESPDQVGELLARGSLWLAYKNEMATKAWDYTFEGYDPQSEKLREALCTVGNGYFATRGAAPESRAGQVHYPGTYAAGVYNRLVDEISGVDIDNESLVNIPNWLPLTFRIDGGPWFDIDAVTVLSYRQTLDLRGATRPQGIPLPRRRRPHQFGDATTIRRDAPGPCRGAVDDDRRRGLVGDDRDPLDPGR